MKRFLRNISLAECLTSFLMILVFYTDSANGVMVTFQGKNYDCVCGCKLVAPSEDGDGWVTKVVPPDSRCDSSNRANQIDIYSITCPCNCTLTIEIGHKPDFDNTKILANLERYDLRTMRESIEIFKRPSSLNRADEAQRNPAMWKPLISSLSTNINFKLISEKTEENKQFDKPKIQSAKQHSHTVSRTQSCYSLRLNNISL